MDRKIEAIKHFLPAVFGNSQKFKKVLMGFSEMDRADAVVAKHGFGKGLPVVDLLDVLPGLDETITSYSFLDGTSHPIDLVLLKGLVKKFENCDYLEIGSWRGESLVNVAPHCRSVVSVSLGKEEMLDMGFPKRVVELDGFFIKNIPNLKRIAHNSTTFDFGTLQQKFDVIFVDGDHSYQGVKNDTAKVFPLLKDENSIIVWHDCGNNYEDMRNDVIAGILDGAPAEKRGHIYRVSNTLCGIYTAKQWRSSVYEHYHRPDKVFEVKMSAQRLEVSK